MLVTGGQKAQQSLFLLRVCSLTVRPPIYEARPIWDEGLLKRDWLSSWLALGDRISGFCDLVWGRGASSYELLPRRENGR